MYLFEHRQKTGVQDSLSESCRSEWRRKVSHPRQGCKSDIHALVDDLDDRYDVRLVLKHSSQRLHEVVRACDVGSVGVPIRSIAEVARVDESVLTAGCTCTKVLHQHELSTNAPARIRTIQCNDNLQAILLCPINSFEEVRKLAGDVRLVGRDIKYPMSDGDPDMVEPTCRDKINADRGTEAHVAHPAAAMSAKSCSVMNVSQCCLSALCATSLF